MKNIVRRKRKIKLEGSYVGRLYIEEFIGFHEYKNRSIQKYRCKCLCGNYKNFTINDLLSKSEITGKSCGCIAKEQREIKKQLNGEDMSRKHLYMRYKSSSKIRNINFNLNFDLFCSLISDKCYYCDIEPYSIHKASKKNKYSKDYVYNGIDRLDNNLGYNIDNCVTCCKACNYAKNAYNADEFLKRIKRIYEKHFIKKMNRLLKRKS